MAATLSSRIRRPYELPGVMLGTRSSPSTSAARARSARPRRHGRRARALPTSSHATPPPSVRDGRRGGRPRRLEHRRRRYDFAPTFSIWTTIEECLNPPLVWERSAASSPPSPSPSRSCSSSRRDRPRRVRQRRTRGGRARAARDRLPPCHVQVRLGEEFIEVLKTLHKLGSTHRPVRVRGAAVSPRTSSRPRSPIPPRSATACTGDVRRHARHRHRPDGGAKAVYLYHAADNERTMREYGHQASCSNRTEPHVALELLDTGAWKAPACSAGVVRRGAVPRPAADYASPRLSTHPPSAPLLLSSPYDWTWTGSIFTVTRVWSG